MVLSLWYKLAVAAVACIISSGGDLFISDEITHTHTQVATHVAVLLD